MILGHERQIEYLNKVLQRGKMAHAYLFYGPEGVGKFTIAKIIAKFLHCEMFQLSSGRLIVGTFDNICHSCSQCLAVDRGTHPHVFILDPEHTLVSKKEKRKDIPIEDIRELKRIFSLAPEGDKWRIAIINQAERMNSEAADALLKLLEEPGGQTLLILVSLNRDLLPQTIVSRTQPVRFSLVSEKNMAIFLKDKVKNIETQKEILTLAAGRPGVAFDLMDDEERLQKEREFWKNIYVILEKGDVPEAFRLSEKMAPVESERTKVIEYILRLLRAKLISGSSEGNTNFLSAKLKNIYRMSTLLDTTNVNARLALDSILLEAISTKI